MRTTFAPANKEKTKQNKQTFFSLIWYIYLYTCGEDAHAFIAFHANLLVE